MHNRPVIAYCRMVAWGMHENPKHYTSSPFFRIVLLPRYSHLFLPKVLETSGIVKEDTADEDHPIKLNKVKKIL